MKTPRHLLGLAKINKQPRVPDKTITIAEDIIILEYSNGFDGFIAKSDPRAESILKNFKM